jgi:hypothetical protein
MGMKNHVKVFHNNINDTHESTGVFNVILTGLSPTQHYRKAVFISDELFYVYWRIEDGKFYCAVLYVGEEEKSPKYKYKFTLTTECGDKKVSMSFPTRYILDNLEELLESGDCVILNYNTVLQFLNSNMYLECEFQINAIETHLDIAGGISQPDLSAKSDIHSSLFSRSKRHQRIRRHEEHTPESSSKLVSVIKLRRCVHGRRLKHCRSCKYVTPLSNTPVSADASGTDSPQNIQSPTGFYCAPSGKFAENASAEKCPVDSKVSPSAPVEKLLYPDIAGKLSSNLSTDRKLYDEEYGYSGRSLSEGNTCSLSDEYVPSYGLSDSTWKCAICEQIAPKVPGSSPDPGWHVTSYAADTKWKCKMCGQIRQ